MDHVAKVEPPYEEELFLAGERVPPGRYQIIDTNREVCLECEDYLPASLDGRVACYRRIRCCWSQFQHRSAEDSIRSDDPD